MRQRSDRSEFVKESAMSCARGYVDSGILQLNVDLFEKKSGATVVSGK